MPEKFFTTSKVPVMPLKPSTPVDLSSYLATGWQAYSANYPAIIGVRWGPMLYIRGVIKPVTGNPMIGQSTYGSAVLVTNNLPAAWQIKKDWVSGQVSDSGWTRQPMSGAGSWYVDPTGNSGQALRGGRMYYPGSTLVSDTTWFPFAIWGYAADATEGL